MLDKAILDQILPVYYAALLVGYASRKQVYVPPTMLKDREQEVVWRPSMNPELRRISLALVFSIRGPGAAMRLSIRPTLRTQSVASGSFLLQYRRKFVS
jgi:hypothetical protein